MAKYVSLLSTEQAAEAARLYTAGATLRQLCARFGQCSNTAIRTALVKQGVPVRPKGGSKRRYPIKARGPLGRPPALNGEEAAEAEDLYVAEKWPRNRIAAYFKVSSTAVDKALANRGVTLRTRSEALSMSATARHQRRRAAASVWDLGRVALATSTEERMTA